jgi:hypothetical protein
MVSSSSSIFPSIFFSVAELTGEFASLEEPTDYSVITIVAVFPADGFDFVESERRVDEDITTVDTTFAPTATLPHIPQFKGPLTRARARQLNYQVLSFLGTIPNIHENMMLPKSDVFMLLRNDGPSMDERDKHWSMIMHGDDGSNRVRI